MNALLSYGNSAYLRGAMGTSFRECICVVLAGAYVREFHDKIKAFGKRILLLDREGAQ